MKPEKAVEEFLRWRLEQARAEAPPAPSASHLLELARPWWEKWPEMFQSQVEKLSRIQVEYDGPATKPTLISSGYFVPALVVRGVEASEGFARVLEFNIHNDRLRFRFQLEPSLSHEEPTLELTFISETSAHPVLLAAASVSVESDYLLETLLLPEIAREWAHLKETDHLPIRLILHCGS